MNKFIKVALVGAVLATLTACTGHIENRDKNCSYDYLLHPANTGLIARRPLDFPRAYLFLHSFRKHHSQD